MLFSVAGFQTSTVKKKNIEKKSFKRLYIDIDRYTHVGFGTWSF
jgi:hypothetical protein